MFKIAICDDEQIIGAQMEQTLMEYAKQVSIEIDVDVFYSGKDLYRQMESGNIFDLIYLDIEMEAMDGIEVGQQLRRSMQNMNTEIVYISGTKE